MVDFSPTPHGGRRARLPGRVPGAAPDTRRPPRIQPMHPTFPMKGLAFLIAAASCAALPLAAQNTLRVGQTVTGTLASGDAQTDEGTYFDAYTIRGRPGERVVVRMRSEDFDTYLRWGYQGDGGWVEEASNDDGGEGTDSRLVVTLSDEGAYELRATSFSEGQEGAYELALSAASVVAPGRIRVGETVQGELTESDAEGDEGFEDHYVFTGRAGDVLTFFAESDEIDTYLTLGTVDDGGFREISTDDDSGEGTNSQLVAELDEIREYHVVVRSFSGEDTGPYTLRVAEGAAEPVEDEEEYEEEVDFVPEEEYTYQGSVIGRVVAGRETRGTLGDGGEEDEGVQYYHDYTYRAAAGERLTIRVSAEELDSFVAIGTGTLDDFSAIGEDDDGGEGLNAELEFEAEEAREYTIRVTSAFPGQVGEYVLRVDSQR